MACKPVNLIGGQVFAGATRYRRIASAYAHGNLVYGDLVKRDNGRHYCPFWLMKPRTGPSSGLSLAFSSAATYTDSSTVIKFVSNSTYPGCITPATGTFINAIIC
jgi:hypothetical protein